MLQEFVQQIKDTAEECIGEIHTALPAKIVSVDTGTGLATVLPTMKKVVSSGKKMDYPQISGVPIVMPQGAGQAVSISYPVKAGDSCLLVISEQSLEYWLYGMETDTTLLFDITNAICIPGLFQTAPSTFAEACNNNSVVIDAGGQRLTVSPSGITVSGNLTVSGSVSVTGNLTTGGTVNGE